LRSEKGALLVQVAQALRGRLGAGRRPVRWQEVAGGLKGERPVVVLDPGAGCAQRQGGVVELVPAFSSAERGVESTNPSPAWCVTAVDIERGQGAESEVMLTREQEWLREARSWRCWPDARQSGADGQVVIGDDADGWAW
jgi:hypothetical protein